MVMICRGDARSAERIPEKPGRQNGEREMEVFSLAESPLACRQEKALTMDTNCVQERVMRKEKKNRSYTVTGLGAKHAGGCPGSSKAGAHRPHAK
jgi:hypothetical protein